MSSKEDRASGMKSAYDLALERLESQGIERPREDSLDAETLDRVADLRQRTEARLAELEILYRDRIRDVSDPTEQAAAEEEYLRERRRLEERRDDQIEQLRIERRPEERPR